MLNYWFIHLFILCFFCFPALAQINPHISEFKIYLFNSKTGAFSNNILETRDISILGNVPIGDFSSVSTFVVVKIVFDTKSSQKQNIKVRMVAAELNQKRNNVIFDNTVSVGPISEDGNSYVGFFIDKTGCKPLSLQSSILGDSNKSSLSVELPFSCYE